MRALDQARLEEATVATTIVPETVVTANLRLFGGTATVKGVVLDAGGVPVAGAQVGGWSNTPDNECNRKIDALRYAPGLNKTSACSSSDEIRGGSFAPLNVPNETVTIQIILDARGTIAGRIFDAGGVPVSGLKVFLLGGQNLSAITYDAGGYRFENVAVGTYVVSAFTSDFSDGKIPHHDPRFVERCVLPTSRSAEKVVLTDRACGEWCYAAWRARGAVGAARQGRTLRPPENPFCLANIQVVDATVELAQCQEVGLRIHFRAVDARRRQRRRKRQVHV